LTPPRLKAAAEAAVECLAIDSGDTVLIVFNDDRAGVAEALASAAGARAGEVTMRDLGRLSRHGEEPPVEVAAAMAAATVVLAPTAWTGKSSHSADGSQGAVCRRSAARAEALAFFS